MSELNDREILFRAGKLMNAHLQKLREQRAEASDMKNIALLEGMIDSTLGGLLAIGHCMGRLHLESMITPEQLADFDAQQDRR